MLKYYRHTDRTIVEGSYVLSTDGCIAGKNSLLFFPTSSGMMGVTTAYGLHNPTSYAHASSVDSSIYLQLMSALDYELTSKSPEDAPDYLGLVLKVREVMRSWTY